MDPFLLTSQSTVKVAIMSVKPSTGLEGVSTTDQTASARTAPWAASMTKPGAIPMNTIADPANPRATHGAGDAVTFSSEVAGWVNITRIIRT